MFLPFKFADEVASLQRNISGANELVFRADEQQALITSVVENPP